MSRRSDKKTKGKSNSSRKSSTTTSWRARLAELAPVVPLGTAACVLSLIGAAVFGLERLREHVYAQPEMNPPVRIELVLDEEQQWVDQEGWAPRIASRVFADTPPPVELPPGEEPCAWVARRMRDSGWVTSVNWAVRDREGVVRVACAFRRPVAMVKLNLSDTAEQDCYLAVDAAGYRLPETYGALGDSRWISVQGLARATEEHPVPAVGQPFTAPDAVAGIELAALLFEQEFSTDIRAVNVDNFQGRRHPGRNHILIYPRDGGVIAWGSAIGDEIEEPGIEDKLRGVAEHLRSGSSQRADVSVYPHAYVRRVDDEAPLQTADNRSRNGP